MVGCHCCDSTATSLTRSGLFDLRAVDVAIGGGMLRWLDFLRLGADQRSSPKDIGACGRLRLPPVQNGRRNHDAGERTQISGGFR